MTEESAVKVCVRVRPLIARESAASESAEPVPLFWKADKKSIHQVDDGNSTKSFVFDRVFTADETTNQLYQDIAKPLVVSTVKGYNGTIFAYGQTSSGKTFTMMGGDRIHGVIPLAVDDVFQTIRNCSKKEFLLRVSYMEIYNETVSDLLVDSCKRKPLEVRETINKNIYVADLTEELVTTTSQVLAWIRKGEENRHYAKTKMNERSSRSHTIFRMILESREIGEPASGEISDGAVIVSHLNLVDLAGSERASQTGAEGTHFKEGVNINRSLFTLSQVIKKLTDESQKGFTNYRDSKLTRILQNSLGGNAKTVIICTITPAALDETLSTLQFACTAKKMKNDPHVTEVSDDGALLKRYRNEIVDLKRRLHEVSSHTHTSATEKEVLSQLLQEKDQLQREQEDRIRNLTRLLVSSSNLVPVRKRPKRRVTWGGKMARLPAHDGSPSGLSSAETFTRKGKADRSCMSALCEEEEDFDSRWEIADEPSYEMDMSQSSVTVRSFEDSPKDFMSPDGGCNLSGKVSNLEMQLEIETRQTEEARTKVETLDAVVAELQLQLQTEARQTQEALEKMQTAEQRAGEVELQLQLHTEAQQKQEANEEVELLKLRVADLEKQLEEQSHTPSDADEQMKKEFAETIQLCETLAKEKDDATTERDYLKEELGMFMEEIKRLEEEKATLSKEKEEKREMDEFVSLEEEFRKEHESELQNEIAKLKSDLVSSELQRLELNNKIETLSKELQSKTEFAEELQSLSGKDLVKEVAALRRSLDDAEGLSRDTKKEWAHLRSKNIAVEEMNVNLNAGYEKLDAELTRLRSQLEAEKSRFKSMQSDLQKELNVAFDENTKLTTLLDGNVPKNLIDSLELERTAARLSRELTSSQEAEGSLRAQLEELSSLRTLPDQLNELMQELQHVRTEKGALLSQQRSAAEETEKLLSAVACLTAERDQLTTDLQEHVEEAAETQLLLQSLQDELQEQTRQNSNVVELAKQKEFESDQHMQSLSEELQRVRAEKDALLSEQRSCAEEAEKLLSSITSLTAERDQLQTDLQENVEMMIENQEELRTALEKNRKQKAQIKLLEAAQQEPEDSASETAAQREQLQTLMIENQEELRASQEKIRLLQDEIDELRSQKAEPEGDAEIELQIQRLTEKLQLVEAERDGLLSEKDSILQTSTEETEKLLCRVTSLSEERDQLLETLEGVRGEERQLRAQLEDKMETMQTERKELPALAEQENQMEGDLQSATEMTAASQSLLQSQENMEQERLQERKAQLEQQVAEAESLLSSLQAELREQRESGLDRQSLVEQLESVRADRDALSLKMSMCQTSTEGTEKLLCRVTSLSEERDQLLETLEAVRGEKQQLRAELEDMMETVQCELQQQLGAEPQSLKEEQDLCSALQIQQLEERLEKREQELSQFKSDLQDNVELMIENQEELRASQEKIRLLQDEIDELRSQKAEPEGDAEIELQIQRLTEKLQLVEAERDGLLSEKDSILQTSTEETEKLLCRATSLSEERDQLLETLEGVRGEERQLRVELEDRMETMQMERKELLALAEQENQMEGDLQSATEMTEASQSLLQSQENMEQERLQERKAQLEQQVAETESLLSSLQEELREQRESGLDRQSLVEQLESVRADRDALSLKMSTCQTSTEETEKLLCRVTSLSEERDQLLETLQGVRGEKQQLRAELEDKMETMQMETRTLSEKLQLLEAERDGLLSEKDSILQTSTEETEKLLCRVTSLSEERDQLLETLEGVRGEERQLRAQLEDKMETMQTEITQLEASLQTVTEQKRELDAELQRSGNETRTLSEKLQHVEAERDGLLSEKDSILQTSTEETEKLLCRVTSLSEERDQLLETLEGVRGEERQLRAQLEDKMETISAIQEQLSEQAQLNSERETELQQTVQQLQLIREGRTSAQVEAGASQQILCDGNLNISALREQLGAMDQSCGGSEETAAALRDSDALLQESCGRFETFIDLFPKYKPHQRLSSTPEPGLDAYNTVRQQQLLMAQALGDIRVQLLARAQGYKSQFENLAKTDSAIFEERRLQDSLLSRAGTPRHSARDEDLGVLWGGRQAELLAKRQLCLQKMSHVLRRLQTKRDLYSSEVSEEVQVRTSFKEQLKALNPIQPQNFGKMDSILSGEVELRSAMAHRRTAALQGVIEEHNSLSEELKLQEARADSLLREEKEKTAALLQVLKDNKQLVLQLRQTEEKVAALRVQIRQLEEAQLKASSRVSNHKEATQLLQTELQDSRAQVEEQHGTIRTLKAKLRQSEENASPSAVELEKLRAKLFKMEVELSSASDGHEREIQKMSTVLKEKEESVRKLKETLRKSQQEGEDSFLQGEELHARLINPRGLVIQTSILLEKTKLEEEVKQLRLKITELESLVSSHQEEIGKWKGRAMKLKVMRKVEVDKTVSPSNPTKRPLSVSSDTSNLLGSPRKVLVTPRKALDSPRKALDSPRKVRDSPRKVRDSPRKARDSPRKARDSPRKARDSPVTSFLDYPKSSFFNGGEGSELLSRTCPKQFFDNSSLGTDPGVFDAPDRAGAEKDAAAGAERKDWWPQSPKQEEMCKTQ
uniref:centromere-associated protein E isoform X7 n=1 Tax=Gasterosteus aculeatus aculeatus TaxID=481459 RepID=UPI001A99E3E7|nr:centromere-associated protein E isoform X7 [Gasterosteus aculeatus aculeatus]